jgi:hypothetical protein
MERTNLFRRKKWSTGTALSLLITALIIIWLIFGTLNVSTSLMDKQLTQLNLTVHRYVVQCYALEGFYPHTLEYLEQNYRLTLDKNLYVFHYRYLGANLFPEIGVFALNSGK